MRHIKDPYEAGRHIIVLSEEEVEIIDFALNARMIKLCEARHIAKRDKDHQTMEWCSRQWEKTLDLQVEWFKILKKED